MVDFGWYGIASGVVDDERTVEMFDVVLPSDAAAGNKTAQLLSVTCWTRGFPWQGRGVALSKGNSERLM